MRMAVVCALAAVLVLVAGLTPAQAQNPIQLSIFNPAQIVKDTEPVNGLRLNILYTKNTSMTGLDLGLVYNENTGSFKGLQSVLVGKVRGDFTGLQWDFVGLVDGKFTGLQWGFYNSAGHISGLQIAFINNATTAYGIQLGLINIIKEGGFLPIFPIFNFSFK